MFINSGGQLGFCACFFVAPAEILFRFFLPALNRLHVRKDQFQVNRLNVTGGIDASVHMNDIFIFKTPDHVDDRIDLSDMAQKFVSETLPAARTFYQSCNINKFYCRRRHFLGMIHFSKHIQPFIRYHNNACIGFYGAERIVFRLCSCIRYCIEKRAFPDVWQPDNTQFHCDSGTPSLFRQ